MNASSKTQASEALKLGVLEQALLLPLAALIMDGGGMFLVVFFALAAYWGGAVVIWARRHGRYTKLDLLLFRWGFFVLCFISFFLARWVWKLRGYVA